MNYRSKDLCFIPLSALYIHLPHSSTGVQRDHKPEYIDRTFSRPFPYNTRAAGDSIRILQHADYSFSSQSFMVRGSKIWNSLPAELRMINKVDKFKKGLRQWITDRVELE